MGYIHCCGTLHKTKTYKVVPQDGFILCELDYLKKCPVCGHTVVQLTRIDKNDNISIVRKVNIIKIVIIPLLYTEIIKIKNIVI